MTCLRRCGAFRGAGYFCLCSKRGGVLFRIKSMEARGPSRPRSCALRLQCFHHKSRNAFSTLGKRLGHLSAVGTLETRQGHLSAVGTLETRQGHLERGRGTCSGWLNAIISVLWAQMSATLGQKNFRLRRISILLKLARTKCII